MERELGFVVRDSAKQRLPRGNVLWQVPVQQGSQTVCQSNVQPGVTYVQTTLHATSTTPQGKQNPSSKPSEEHPNVYLSKDRKKREKYKKK